MDIPILYEDETIVVIDKPSGVVVWDEKSIDVETIKSWAQKYLKIPPRGTRGTFDSRDTFYNRGGIVHRLDKETSGCLIIAKNPQAFSKLTQAFKNRQVIKIYQALVHGKVVPDQGEVRVPTGRIPGKKWEFGVVPGGKEAVTKYKSIRNYELRIKNLVEIFTLVELNPETGRTHQIRIHLKYLGYPIVGDYLYAPKKLKRQDRLWCPRVFLHALSVTFPHPIKNTNITVESSLPPLLQKVLESLG